MNKSAEVLEKLESFYKNETFFDGLLHETCENAKDCWEEFTDIVKKKSDWNYFSLPFIGKEYKVELLCVALNVNEGGGRHLQEIQIRGIESFKKENKTPHENDIYRDKYDPGVIESFKINRERKVKFEKDMKKANKTYVGTDLWHRIAVYSKILLNGYYPDVADDFDKLAEIYEHIIFMDAIKCSPANVKSEKTERSSPKKKMYELCPKHIFYKELNIIKPNNLLIMDHGVAEQIRKEYKPVIEGSKNFPGSGKDYDYCKIKIGDKNINVYYIVHPTERTNRGVRPELIQEFADFVKKQKQI